jgi:putative membrane protein
MMGLGMGFGLMGPLMIAFWIGLIVLVVLAARAVFSGGTPPRTDTPFSAPNARQILDQRYAKGEIDREKYELMRSDLGNG